MLDESVDAGGESANVKKAGRGHHCRVRRDQGLKRSQNVKDRKMRMANPFWQPCK
jgi:hypothetical protein